MNQRDTLLEEALRVVPREAVEGLVAQIRGGGPVMVDFGWRDGGGAGGNPVGLAMSEASFRRILEGQAVDGETDWEAGAALELALGAFPKWAAQYVESATEPLPVEARNRLLEIAEYVLDG